MAAHRTGEAGLSLIRRFEGFSPGIYLCPAGYRTIGYGHVVLPGEAFPEAIDEAEATRLLEQDVKIAESAVSRLIHTPLLASQFDALVSFTFNLGGGSLQRSALRRNVNRREHRAAAEEFSRWIWAGGRKSPGLQRRRMAERDLYLSEL